MAIDLQNMNPVQEAVYWLAALQAILEFHLKTGRISPSETAIVELKKKLEELPPKHWMQDLYKMLVTQFNPLIHEQSK